MVVDKDICNYLIHTIDETTRYFTDELAEKFSGRTVFCTSLLKESYMLDTKVSDILSVMGDIKISLFTQLEDYENPVIMDVSVAQRKYFREIKVFPPTTLDIKFNILAPKGESLDGEWGVANTPHIPVFQKSDGSFENLYMRNKKWLYDTNGRTIGPCYYMTNQFGAMEYLKQAKECVSMYWDLKNLWGVVYRHKGIDFVFVTEPEDVKRVLHDRDAVKGRRRTLPVIVNRKNGGHMRAADYEVTMYGRDFAVWVGRETNNTVNVHNVKREHIEILTEEGA